MLMLSVVQIVIYKLEIHALGLNAIQHPSVFALTRNLHAASATVTGLLIQHVPVI
jgi:hypothetical protein